MLSSLSRHLLFSARLAPSTRLSPRIQHYSTSTMSDVKTLVETAIDENTVAIFSKSWCGYCARAKALFKEKYPDVPTKIYELDLMEEGNEIQSYLLSKTKQRSVPNIFVNQQHVGGSDDVAAADRSGKLKTLIEGTA